VDRYPELVAGSSDPATRPLWERKVKLFGKYHTQIASAPTHYVPMRGDKWQPDEDARLMELLGEKGMDWKDISKELPGRSGKSCSQRYYQVLSKRLLSDPKTEKIVRLYTRERARMWEPIAKEMGLPWSTVFSIMAKKDDDAKNKDNLD